MPPLFMFGFSSEQKVTHRMREMAEEKTHSSNVTQWAEEQQKRRETMKAQRDLLTEDSKRRSQSSSTSNGIIDPSSTRTNNGASKLSNSLSEADRDRQLSELYRKSVENSGIRIVPGSTLGLHHRIANFWQENPFKILTALSVPTVGIIFKTRSAKAHLQFQSMVMHTRVFGQFAVIIMLLTLMGFKGYMDVNGKFVTETDSEVRVEEMKAARIDLLERLKYDKDNTDYIENLKIRARKERAEERELQEKNKKELKKKKRKEKKQREEEKEDITVVKNV